MKQLLNRAQLLIISLLFSFIGSSQPGPFTIGFGVGNAPTTYDGCGNSVLLVVPGFPTNFLNGPFTYTWQSKEQTSNTWTNLLVTQNNSATTGTLTVPMHYRAIVQDVNNQSVTSNTISYNFLTIPTPPTISPATQNVIFGNNSTPQNFTSSVPITGNYIMYRSDWQSSNDGINWSFTNGESMFSIYPLYTAPINTEPGLFSYNFVPYAEGTKYFRVKVRPDFGLIPNECADYTSVYSNVVRLDIYSPIISGNTIFQDGQSNFTGCGNSVTLLANPSASGGKPPYAYRWERKLQSSNTWSVMPNSNTESIQTGVITEPMHYRRVVIDSRGVEAIGGVGNYNFLIKPTVPTFQPTTQTITLGSGAIFQNVTNTSQITGNYPAYYNFWEHADNINGPWDFFNSDFNFSSQSNGANVSIPIFLRANQTPPTQIGTKYYRSRSYPVNVDNSCINYVTVFSPIISATVINAVPINGGTIRPITNVYNFCNGTTPPELIVWDVPTGGSGNLTGIWQQKILPTGNWTDIANSNSDNYQSPTFTGSRMFRRKVTDVVGTIGYSSEITITANDCSTPLTGGTIQYSGSSNAICGNSVPQQFVNVTAATGGAGGTVYTWQYKPETSISWINFSNSNSVSYLPTVVFTESFTIRRRAVDQVGNFSYSNQILITALSTTPLDAGNIVYTDFICFNTSLAPIQNTRSPQGGGGSHLYSWEKLISGVWTVFTTPSSTALSLSNTSANTSVFPTTGSFRRKVTDQCGNIAYSNTCIVSSQFVSAGSIQIANNTINAGQTPNVILSGFMPSAGQPEDYGSNSPLVLSWVSSTNINGPWVVIPNATFVGYQSGPLFQTTYFRRVASETICNKTDTSNILTIIVNGFLNPGTITSTQHNTTVCSGNVLNNIANVTDATSSSNNLTYEWQYINATVGVWTSIANSNSTSYTPQPITQNTRFRRKVTDGNNLVVFSNEIVINVIAVSPILQITNGSNITTTCSGVLTLTTNAVNIVSYQWQKLDNGVYININGADLSSYNITEPGTYRVLGTTTCGTSPIISNSSTVTITNFGLTPSLIITNPNPLVGECSSIGNLKVVSVAVNGLEWQRLVNGAFVTIPVGSVNEYNVNTTGSGTYRVKANLICGGATIYSNSILVNITPPGNPSEFGNGIWRFYGFDGVSDDLSQNTYKGFYDNDVPTNPNNFYTQDHWYQYNSPFSMIYDPTPFTSDWYGCSFQSNNSLTVVAKRRGFDCGNYNLWVRVSSGDRLKLVVDGTVVRETYTATPGFSNEFLSSPITLNANSTIEVWTSSSTAGTFINFEARRIGATNLVGGTITPSTQNITLGATPSLLANATNPTGGNGSSYLYQWEQSNQFIGPFTEIANAIGNSLQLGALYQTTYVRRKTYQAGCSYGAYSNVVTITLPTVLQIEGGTIGLNGATTIICNGVAPTLISSINNATNGTGNYTYTWQKNESNTGWIDIASSNILNYQPLAITTATNYRRKVVDNLNNTAFSNEITFTVISCNLDLNAGSITYAGNTTICANTKITTINNVSIATGGTGNLTYEWQQKLASNNVWTTIANSNSESYLPKVNITENTTFRRKVTDGLGAIAYSNEIAITVLTSTGTLVGGQTEDVDHTCATIYKARIDSYSGAIGGVSPYAYVWQQLQSGNWVDVSTTTTTATNFATASQTAALVTTVGTFRRKVTDYCNSTAYTNQAIVNLQTITPGTVGIASSTITAGQTPSLITNLSDPTCATNEDLGSGNQVTISSHWQQATDINGVWTTIAGANSLTYQPPALTQTTYFKRVSREGFCSMSAASNVITVSVYNGPLIGGTIGANNNCVLMGSSVGTINNTTSAAGGRFPYTYEWQINENGNWIIVNGVSTATFNAGNINQNTSFRRKVTDALGNSMYSNTLEIKVISSALHAGLIARPLFVCPTINDVFLYDNLRACGGLDSLHYQWEMNTNNTGWTNIPNANAVSLSIQNLNLDTKFRRKVTDGCLNSVYSNIVNVYMYPEIIAGTVLPIEQTICRNSTQLPKKLAITQNYHYTNGSISYQWQKFTFTNPTWTDIPNATQASYQPPVSNEVVYYQLKVSSTTCNSFAISSSSVVYVNNNCTGQKLIAKKQKPIKK